MTEQTTTEMEELEQLGRDFENMKPLLTAEVLDQIERDIGSNQPWGPWRRAGLACLTRSGRQLIEGLETDRDAAVAVAAVANGTKDYAKRLRELAELMDKANLRLLMALCWRDDIEEIMSEAKAPEGAVSHLRLVADNSTPTIHA